MATSYELIRTRQFQRLRMILDSRTKISNVDVSIRGISTRIDRIEERCIRL